jgi:DNA topoisomerase-1
VTTNLTCPKCHEGQLVIKFGRNGEFLACNRYPECDFTGDFHRDDEGQVVIKVASAPEFSDVMCNLCGKPMVIKKSRFGPFLGCSGYPECTNTRRLGKDGKPVPLPEPTGIACPKCKQGELMQRRGKFGRPFYGCNRYPKCDYLVNDLAEVAQYVPGAAGTQPATSRARTPAKTAKASGAPASAKTNGRTATSAAKASKATATTSKRTTAKRAGTTKKKPASARRG